MLSKPSLDYTDKDYQSLLFRLRNLIRSVFPEWSDFNVANFGVILLELYAHVGDVLLFYQDAQARQSRISTATQRKALIGLAKMLSFRPATATAATTDVRIELPSPPAADVLFPAGTVIVTESASAPIRYQLLNDASISAGQNPPRVDAPAENSEPRDEVFGATGQPNQAIRLAKTPYIDGSAVIVAGNGAFTEVETLLNSTSSDRHFTVVVDQNDRAEIRFGNGANGALPAGAISVAYKTGGGRGGRVESGALTAFEQTAWTDTAGNPVYPSVTNLSPSSGGDDRQGVMQIRERAPATLRALTRSVSRDDFVVNALRLSEVARALMLTRNEDPGIAENAGELYVVPASGGLPSQALKDAVKAKVTVDYPHTLTFDLQVRDPVFVDINVFAVVYFSSGTSAAVGAARIRAALAAFFAVQNPDGTANVGIDFGGNLVDAEGTITGELALSDVYNVVRDTFGVRKIGDSPADFTVNGEHADFYLAPREFPRLGTVTLFDGATGVQI